MAFKRLGLFLSFVGLMGCKGMDYIVPESNNRATFKQEFGTHILYTTYCPSSADTSSSNYGPMSVFSGPAMKIRKDGCQIIELGQEESVHLPDEFNNLGIPYNETAIAVKAGRWHYYSENGLVDSIVSYGQLKTFAWRVDTLVVDGRALAVDSSLIPIYKKKQVLFTRSK